MLGALVQGWRRLRAWVFTQPWASLALLVGLVLMAGAVMAGEQHPIAWPLWLTSSRAGALGTVLTFLAAVPLLFRPPSGNAWVNLLTEPGGGLSLGKTQLLLWVTAAVGIYGGVTLPATTNLGYPPGLAGLLGGSIATTALAAAANPSREALAGVEAPGAALSLSGLLRDALRRLRVPWGAPQEQAMSAALGQTAASQELVGVVREIAATCGRAVTEAEAQAALAAALEPPAPRLLDLVEDWRGHGDVSRYQFLFLSALGSALLLIYFLKTQHAPDVPTDLYYLMGASAGGYLGAKGVKTVRMENEGGAG